MLLDGPVNPEGRFDIGLHRQGGGTPPLPPPPPTAWIRSAGVQDVRKVSPSAPRGSPGDIFLTIFDNFEISEKRGGPPPISGMFFSNMTLTSFVCGFRVAGSNKFGTPSSHHMTPPLRESPVHHFCSILDFHCFGNPGHEKVSKKGSAETYSAFFDHF